ncbi:arylsulfatase [Cyclobacterium plantarum]|nr:arylsulfatase [Cyclobacterium plantarum]
MKLSFIGNRMLLFTMLLMGFMANLHAYQQTDRPNVVLIITDDQGYGDLGITGNPHVQTPVLDQLGKESIRLNQFYVSPVCAPTRSSLMTGRYSLRTGVRDTYNGGAIMATAEVTIAEMLKEVGYNTGIFGKWHLGDNYPFRPGDQGFDESLIHLSGGMGQPGDFTTFFKGDSSYFDPVLWHNGQQKAYRGYCSDVFTNEAIGFLEENREDPFFLYLSFNAPHTPLQVPAEYYERYKDIDPAAGFDADGQPFPEMNEKNKEDARKVYAMVSNIDDNVGRLLKKLDELEIADNTLVIFMTDNGPQQPRYVAGMRGRKGNVFRGGVRVPFFLRLPGRLQGNKDIEANLAHIDVLPTLAEICDAPIPGDRKIDGQSFHALLRGETADEFEDRPLFFYWTRRYPELYNNIALHKGDFKLVGNADHDAALEAFGLFNVKEDPYEQEDIVRSNRALAEDLKSEMDEVIADLTQSSNLNVAQRMIIGSEHENPVYLNRNDADGERGIWTQEEVFGMWKVKTLEGRYNIRFKFIKPLETNGKMVLETNSIIVQEHYEEVPTDEITMKNVYLPEMEVDLIPHYMTEGRSIFPLWVEMEKITGP